MSGTRRRVLLAVGVLMAGAVVQLALGGKPGDPAPPKVRTILVECHKGGSIQTALADSAPVLVVEVRGICRENVVVERDQVTLHGSDPAVDGIMSAWETVPDGLYWEANALTIRNSRYVLVENLSLMGAPLSGLRVVNSRRGIDLVNCRLDGNGNYGLILEDAVTAAANSTFSDNAVGGIAATENSWLTCTDCTIVNPAPEGGWTSGVEASRNSTISLATSDPAIRTLVDASYPLNALVYSRVVVTNGNVQISTPAEVDATGEGDYVPDRNGASANQYSLVRLESSTLAGYFWASDKSTISIRNTTQSGVTCEGSECSDYDPWVNGNSIFRDSHLLVARAAKLDGYTFINRFSSGELLGNTELTEGGLVQCDAQSDVFCGAPGTWTLNILGCKSCLACVASCGEYVISGGEDPSAGIYVDDFLDVYLRNVAGGDQPILTINQGGGCCPAAAPVRFRACTGEQLRLVARDGNTCYSIESLYLQKADGSCRIKLTDPIYGPNCGSEPPESVFFDGTFTLP